MSTTLFRLTPRRQVWHSLGQAERGDREPDRHHPLTSGCPLGPHLSGGLPVRRGQLLILGSIFRPWGAAPNPGQSSEITGDPRDLRLSGWFRISAGSPRPGTRGVLGTCPRHYGPSPQAGPLHCTGGRTRVRASMPRRGDPALSPGVLTPDVRTARGFPRAVLGVLLPFRWREQRLLTWVIRLWRPGRAFVVQGRFSWPPPQFLGVS